MAIISALPRFPDEYGRCGGPIALQMRAFVLVMRYTGLFIGDVATRSKVAKERRVAVRSLRGRNLP